MNEENVNRFFTALNALGGQDDMEGITIAEKGAGFAQYIHLLGYMAASDQVNPDSKKKLAGAGKK